MPFGTHCQNRGPRRFLLISPFKPIKGSPKHKHTHTHRHHPFKAFWLSVDNGTGHFPPVPCLGLRRRYMMTYRIQMRFWRTCIHRGFVTSTLPHSRNLLPLWVSFGSLTTRAGSDPSVSCIYIYIYIYTYIYIHVHRGSSVDRLLYQFLILTCFSSLAHAAAQAGVQPTC